MIAFGISLRFNGHFPGGPGLASTNRMDFIGSKDDGGGEWQQLEL